MNVDNDASRMEGVLKDALRRREAPEGFADRVLARVAERDSARAITSRRESWLRLFAQPLVRWAAVATCCAALVVGGVYYRNVERERAEGEAAKQRLILALRIAGSKLQLARSRVNHISANQSENLEEKE